MARDHRRLAAIVSADVVGYSRLMGRDESGTLARLKAHRRELIDPKIAEHDGRIVKTTGDGLLLEFPSVVDAVRCAVEVQRGMAERNVGVPEVDQIWFRLGINVGDIIIDDDDIFGDGVNVAARLQTLAEPGGICVSRVVRDQVLDKLSFVFDDIGAQQVKNIARPIEVYRIRDEATAGGIAHTGPTRTPQADKRDRSIRAKRRWVMGALALGLGGVAAWQLPRLLETVSGRPLPTLSVAVMPFVGTPGVSADEQFADALTENLRTLMGKSHVLTVASGRKVLSYRNKESDAQNIGRELNVRYLVDGEIRSADRKMAITVHLIDAESGTTVWTDKLETDATPSAEENSMQTKKLTRLLGEAIYTTEELRAATHPVPGSAPDLWLRGNAAMRLSMGQPEKLTGARKFYDEALRINPNYVAALLGLARMLDGLLTEDLEADRSTRAQRIKELDDLTARAIRINDGYANAWYERAQALLWLGRFDQALTANAKGQSLEDIPDSAAADQQVDIVLALDRPEEALALAQRATAISPVSNTGQEGWSMRQVCESNLLLGRYGAAADACEKAAARDNWWFDQMLLAAIYAQLGDAEKGAAAKAVLLRKKPGVTIEKLKAIDPATSNPGYLHRAQTYLYAGLRKSGIADK